MPLAPSVIRYGGTGPLPESRLLRAGPLSLLFEEGDLRYVRLGKVEIIRRIYIAVRDRNWETIPIGLSCLRIDEADDSFHITYDADHREREIDFHWRGEIVGDRHGSIRFIMDGVARSTFERNRIGFG